MKIVPSSFLILLTGGVLSAAAPVFSGEVAEKDSGDSKAALPRVESKTLSRKGAVPAPHAVVEGDVKDMEPAPEAPPESAADAAPVKEAGIQEEQEFVEGEGLYTPVAEGGGSSPGSSEPSAAEGAASPDSGKKEHFPLLLPELTRKELDEPYRSASSSKQFICVGEDMRLCSSLATFAEDVKKEMLELLGEEDKWKGNITIHLKGRSGDPVVTAPITAGINLIGGAPFFVVNVAVGQGIDMYSLRMKLVEVIIFERALRHLPENVYPETMSIPAWLMVGFNEAVLWKKDQADRNLYAMLFERGDILTLKELFRIKAPLTELDASTLGVYRASCGALVLSLLNQGGGRESFKRMLNQSILSTVDGTTMLKQNFPGLHLSQNSLYKWWALQLSGMAARPMTELQTALETERKLDEYSHVPYYEPSAKVVMMTGPEHYKLLLGLPPESRNALLQPMLINLVQLSYRAFPPQRRLIVEYIRLVESIIRGRIPEDMDKQLERLKEERRLIKKAGTRSRDYIDWYTIVTATRTSGSFDSYFRAMEMLREDRKPKADAMTRYLDDMEKLVAPGY